MRANLCARRPLCSFEFSHYHLENQCLRYRCVNAQLNGVQALVTWLVFVFGVNSCFMLRCHKPQLEYAHGNYPSLKVKNTKDFWISWEAPKSSSNVKIRYTLRPSITWASFFQYGLKDENMLSYIGSYLLFVQPCFCFFFTIRTDRREKRLKFVFNWIFKNLMRQMCKKRKIQGKTCKL